MFGINKFEGLVAAPFAPLGKDGSVNTSVIPQYYELLEKNGIAGVFINGTTGEGVSLTSREREVIAREWAGCLKNRGKVRVINLVGGTSLRECIDNAQLSSGLGLSAIAVLPPFYFKPGKEALAEFFIETGSSVPGMPVYYYHIPSMTGVNMPVIELMEPFSGLKNFAGVKYTNEDLADFMSCLNYKNGRYDLLWGMDEYLLPALSVGAKGAVGSTYNYAAPLYHRMIKAFRENDIPTARQLQLKSIEIINLLSKFGGIATGKAFMKYIGIDCGKFRLPVQNMSDDMYGSFLEDVKNLEKEHLFSKL